MPRSFHTMSPDAVADVYLQLVAAETLTTDEIETLRTMPDEVLRMLVGHHEAQHRACEPDWKPAGHQEPTCPACLARDLLDMRQRLLESTRPGALPLPHEPQLVRVEMTRPASAIMIGDVVRHWPLPGGQDAVHVEAVVRPGVHEGPTIWITWQLTNSDEPPFEVTYPADAPVLLFRETWATWASRNGAKVIR